MTIEEKAWMTPGVFRQLTDEMLPIVWLKFGAVGASPMGALWDLPEPGVVDISAGQQKQAARLRFNAELTAFKSDPAVGK